MKRQGVAYDNKSKKALPWRVSNNILFVTQHSEFLYMIMMAKDIQICRVSKRLFPFYILRNVSASLFYECCSLLLIMQLIALQQTALTLVNLLCMQHHKYFCTLVQIIDLRTGATTSERGTFPATQNSWMNTHVHNRSKFVSD